MQCIPSHASTNSKHKQHNRELKKLRKQKIRAQRALRAAQREHKCVEDQRRLGLEYRQTVRQYHTALKKKKRSARRTDISRVRKECARSFWKFVSKILDDDQTASNIRIANLPLMVLQHSRTSHVSMLQTRELLTLHSGSQTLLILNFPSTMI